jgi:hypothetical protein
MKDSLESISKQVIRVSPSNHYSVVGDWCANNNVDAMYIGRYYGRDLWFIKSLSDRMLFVLRWV